MTPSPLHLSILKTVFEAKPRTFSVPEIFWALNEKREHSLLINCLKALADLRESGLISHCDPPELTELGTMTLLGHVCGFAEVQQNSCGTSAEVGKAGSNVSVEGLGAGTVVPDNRANTAVNTARTSGRESQQNCAGLGEGWGILPAGIQLADAMPAVSTAQMAHIVGSAEESALSAASADFAGAGAGDSAHLSSTLLLGCAHDLGRCAVTPEGNEQRSFGVSSEDHEAPKHSGTTITELERSVVRAEDRAKLFLQTTAELIPEYVCANPDCLKVCTRLFSCDFCGECERRCSECLAEHEAAGHESDTTNAQHMYSGIRLVKP